MKMIKVIPENCTGCRLCEVTCSFAHYRVSTPELRRIHIVKEEERGDHAVRLCIQCADAPCIESCPAEALNRDEKTGVVLVDEHECIGCGNCEDACPIGAVYMHPEDDVAIKCDLCGGDPECVQICAREALRVEEMELTDPSKNLFLEKTSEQLRNLIGGN